VIKPLSREIEKENFGGQVKITCHVNQQVSSDGSTEDLSKVTVANGFKKHLNAV